jgi:hypothetical protein
MAGPMLDRRQPKVGTNAAGNIPAIRDAAETRAFVRPRRFSLIGLRRTNHAGRTIELPKPRIIAFSWSNEKLWAVDINAVANPVNISAVLMIHRVPNLSIARRLRDRQR